MGIEAPEGWWVQAQRQAIKLGCTLLVPLDFSYAIRGTGDTDGYVLDLAATLEKRLDLLAEAFVGSLGRSGVCLVHAGYSVMSH